MLPLSKIKRDCKRWGFWCRILGLDIEAEMEKMHDYISAYYDMVEPYKKKGSKTHQTALPESIRVAWCLMERMTEQEAWNCPMARALAYYTAQAEYNGQEFMTEKEAIKLKVI